MRDGDILIIGGEEAAELLTGQETSILDAVKRAYAAHAKGDTFLPNSTFVRFPLEPQNRIISLSGYLGAEFNVAGTKWISSFPRNAELEMERASAVVVLNSTRTGRPQTLLEGSIISAKRTAASAALAAQILLEKQQPSALGLLGCGPINFEIARFLVHIYPALKSVYLYDLNQERMTNFKAKLSDSFKLDGIHLCESLPELLSSASLISMATTAATPHINSLPDCPAGNLILHISLRDLAPEIIRDCENIVDDVDHVCRAQTSIHLEEQAVGHREFIRCTLGEIINHTTPAPESHNKWRVFSPFGLGILDLAVGKLVHDLAVANGKGFLFKSFIPAPWMQRP